MFLPRRTRPPSAWLLQPPPASLRDLSRGQTVLYTICLIVVRAYLLHGKFYTRLNQLVISSKFSEQSPHSARTITETADPQTISGLTSGRVVYSAASFRINFYSGGLDLTLTVIVM